MAKQPAKKAIAKKAAAKAAPAKKAPAKKAPAKKAPAKKAGDNNPPAPVFHEPTFSEGTMQPIPSGFITPHASDKALYDWLDKNAKNKTVSFPQSRVADNEFFTLAQAYGPRGADVVAKITQQKNIVFHALGDSGATQEGKAHEYEIDLVEQMVQDCTKTQPGDGDGNRPSFLFHLGDLVYDFGESAYYFDQFYSAFRDYPAPIFAIPGNHDSFIASIAPASVAPEEHGVEDPLTVFIRNFCADRLTITREAGSLHRTAMQQPGVYYALDAPFVRIISLFSNSLEDPGLISSEGGKWPGVPDYQLDFLRTQLKLIKQSNYTGAVLLAMHHPPFSYRAKTAKDDAASVGTHAANQAMLAEIDGICTDVGVYPHAIISGHAHNYQRYERSFSFAGKDIQVPFIVTGSGGHHVNTLTRAGYKADPGYDTDVSYLDSASKVAPSKLAFKYYNDRDYTYLRVSVDKDTLRISSYVAAGSNAVLGRFDKVTVDLKTRRILPN